MCFFDGIKSSFVGPMGGVGVVVKVSLDRKDVISTFRGKTVILDFRTGDNVIRGGLLRLKVFH